MENIEAVGLLGVDLSDLQRRLDEELRAQEEVLRSGVKYQQIAERYRDEESGVPAWKVAA